MEQYERVTLDQIGMRVHVLHKLNNVVLYVGFINGYDAR